MPDTAISIGELSRRTGCNIETIRYYERIALTPPPLRRGRFRKYGREDVARLSFVRRARELGFTLDDIRALLGLAGGAHESCEAVRALASAHLGRVRARIADLRRMERVLAEAVDNCIDGEPGCAVIAALTVRTAPGVAGGSPLAG